MFVPRASLAATVLLLIGLAACGGASDSELVAECREEGVDAFVEQFSTFADPSLEAPEASARETLRLFCEEAVRRGIHESDANVEELQESLAVIVQEKPEIMYPVCVGSAMSGFDTLPPELQTQEMRTELESAGQRYCEIAIDEGYLTFEPTSTDEMVRDIDRIYREHPELTTPTCVLGGMAGYEDNPLVIEGVEVRPERAEEYLRRICTEAATAGAMGGMSLEPTPAQSQQIDAIATRILDEMVAAGELP